MPDISEKRPSDSFPLPAKKIRFDDEGNMEDVVVEPVTEVQRVEPVFDEGKQAKKMDMKLKKKEKHRMRRLKEAVADKVVEVEGSADKADVPVTEPEEQPEAKIEESKEEVAKAAEEKTEETVEVKGESNDKTETKDTITDKEPEKETKATRAKDAALYYLHLFTEDKSKWKFKKVRQAWILRNLYYEKQIDHINFKQYLLLI
jgi:WKF domain